MDKNSIAALVARGEQIKTADAAGQAGRRQSQGRSRTSAAASAPAERRRACNEATPMKMKRDCIDRFDIDHGANGAPPPPRRQSNVQQCTPGYLWNSTTQELIPILPEDHPDYRQNEEIIAAAIRRWNGGTSR